MTPQLNFLTDEDVAGIVPEMRLWTNCRISIIGQTIGIAGKDHSIEGIPPAPFSVNFRYTGNRYEIGVSALGSVSTRQHCQMARNFATFALHLTQVLRSKQNE